MTSEKLYKIGSTLAASAALFMGGIAAEALLTNHDNTAVIFGALAVAEASAALALRSSTTVGEIHSQNTD